MNLKELFMNQDFLLSTNLDLALYALAEDLGITKADILSGKYDKEFNVCKKKIYKQFDRLIKSNA